MNRLPLSNPLQTLPSVTSAITRRRFVAASSAAALTAATNPLLLAQNRNPHVCLAWRGAGNDQNIWFVFDPIPNAGRSSGTPQQIGAFATATRPALIGVGGRLLMAWRGINGDDSLYFSTYDGLNWAPQRHFSGFGSSTGPALTAWGPGAFMVWRGSGADTKIYSSIWDQSSGAWTPQRQLGLGSAHTPAVVSFAGKLLMVWRGEGDNQSLYHAQSRDGVSWSPPQMIEQASTETTPALTLFQGKPFLAFKGVRSDSSMYASRFTDGVGFGTWQFRWQLPYFGTSFGPTLSVIYNDLFLTWKGVGGDLAIYYSQSATGDAGTWSGQAKIPNAGSDFGQPQPSSSPEAPGAFYPCAPLASRLMETNLTPYRVFLRTQKASCSQCPTSAPKNTSNYTATVTLTYTPIRVATVTSSAPNTTRMSKSTAICPRVRQRMRYKRRSSPWPGRSR